MVALLKIKVSYASLMNVHSVYDKHYLGLFFIIENIVYVCVELKLLNLR